MSLPYEILIRSKDGTLRSAAAYDTPTSTARPLSSDEVALFGGELQAAAVSRIAELEKEITELKAPKPSAIGEISKLTLMRRLELVGKWVAFKELLTKLPESTQDAWALAQSVRSDDPLFIQAAPILKEALQLTDEEFTALFF